jgi:hypothetical protein
MDDSTTYPGPSSPAMVLALAGDSTMTRGFAPRGAAFDFDEESSAWSTSSLVWVRSVDVIVVATG